MRASLPRSVARCARAEIARHYTVVPARTVTSQIFEALCPQCSLKEGAKVPVRPFKSFDDKKSGWECWDCQRRKRKVMVPFPRPSALEAPAPTGPGQKAKGD